MSAKLIQSREYGAPVLLKCQKCGAVFRTKNIAPVGTRAIFMSNKIESLKRGLACDAAGHTTRDLVIVQPDLKGGQQ